MFWKWGPWLLLLLLLRSIPSFTTLNSSLNISCFAIVVKIYVTSRNRSANCNLQNQHHWFENVQDFSEVLEWSRPWIEPRAAMQCLICQQPAAVIFEATTLAGPNRAKTEVIVMGVKQLAPIHWRMYNKMARARGQHWDAGGVETETPDACDVMWGEGPSQEIFDFFIRNSACFGASWEVFLFRYSDCGVPSLLQFSLQIHIMLAAGRFPEIKSGGN